MGEQLAKVAALLAPVVGRAWAAASDGWRALPKREHRYRPEAHYMRGPGPKWRAKHAPSRV
jgi:hypothetical protein